jgi:hypothetical protein
VPCQEASDQSVELPDDEPRSIHRLLMYLYKDDYATTISMSDFHEAKSATRPVEADMKDPEEEPMVHAAMYAVAETSQRSQVRESVCRQTCLQCSAFQDAHGHTCFDS